jgi:hypothetical protein
LLSLRLKRKKLSLNNTDNFSLHERR